MARRLRFSITIIYEYIAARRLASRLNSRGRTGVAGTTVVIGIVGVVMVVTVPVIGIGVPVIGIGVGIGVTV